MLGPPVRIGLTSSLPLPRFSQNWFSVWTFVLFSSTRFVFLTYIWQFLSILFPYTLKYRDMLESSNLTRNKCIWGREWQLTPSLGYVCIFLVCLVFICVFLFIFVFFFVFIFEAGMEEWQLSLPLARRLDPQYKGAQCCPPLVPLDNRMRSGGGSKCVFVYYCLFSVFGFGFFQGWTPQYKGAQYCPPLVPQDNWMRREQMWRMYLCIFCLLCVCIFCIFPRPDLTKQILSNTVLSSCHRIIGWRGSKCAVIPDLTLRKGELRLYLCSTETREVLNMYTVKRRNIFVCISQIPRDILKPGFSWCWEKGYIDRPHLLFVPQEKGKWIDNFCVPVVLGVTAKQHDQTKLTYCYPRINCEPARWSNIVETNECHSLSVQQLSVAWLLTLAGGQLAWSSQRN